MTLDTYLNEIAETAEQFAARAGLDPATISRIRNGDVTPRLDTALAIEKASGGKVTISEIMKVRKQAASA